MAFVLACNFQKQHLNNLAAHSVVVLKAESMAEKVEWINKMTNIIQPSKGGVQPKGASSEGGLKMRQSHSDGSLVSIYWCSLSLLFPAVCMLLDWELCF